MQDCVDTKGCKKSVGLAHKLEIALTELIWHAGRRLVLEGIRIPSIHWVNRRPSLAKTVNEECPGEET
jgi:hypothetical protein